MINKKQIAFAHDVLAALLSFGLAYYLRIGSDAFDSYGHTIIVCSLIFTPIAAASFSFFGLYRGIWRYASLSDLEGILKAVTAAVAVFALAMVVLTRFESIPRSVPIIQWLLLTMMLSGSRLAIRLRKDRRLRQFAAKQDDRRIPVLLIGANNPGELFIRAVQGNMHAPYRVVAVLDNQPGLAGRQIRGVPIYDASSNLPGILERLAQRGEQPQRLVLTDPRQTGGISLHCLVDLAEASGLTLSRLPSLEELREAGGPELTELRQVALEDLLGRPQVALNIDAMRGLISGRRVLITGSGGTIGMELTRQIARFGPAELTLVDSSEFNLYSIHLEVRETWPTLSCQPVLCDVRNRDRVFATVRGCRPDLVFHAAALKHVPLVEMNPGEGALTNVVGTRNVADAARAIQAQAMVLISTDKAVNPTSIMGATKHLAEQYCQALDLAGAGAGVVAGDGDQADRPSGQAPARETRFIVVRFGNVLGSSGSVLPLFQRQLARGGPLTVTHPEIRRYFMLVNEAVRLVLHASAYAAESQVERGHVLVLDMGEPVRILDMARQLIQLSGLAPNDDIKIVFTGLRPGEKLNEELFGATEVPRKTGAAGVMATVPPPVTLAMLNRVFDELAEAAARGDADGVRRILLPSPTAQPRGEEAAAEPERKAQ
ncbi:MAG: polysaccharide biosynthesis protein [Rhodospirillaceae bacterium]|nr:polysaccharide biosynthesis protein [Rhodospirillaceae bacterium]